MLLGFLSIISGIVMFMKYGEYHVETAKPFAMIDAVKGALIVILARLARD